MCDPIQVSLLKMRPHYSQSSRQKGTPSSDTSPLASYKEVPFPSPPGSYFWKHLRHFCWSNLIKVKLKAKEGKNPTGSAFSWSVGRRVDCCFTWVSFVQVLLFCIRSCCLWSFRSQRIFSWSCRISSPLFHRFIMHTWLSSHSVYSWTSIKRPPIKRPSSTKRPVINAPK